MKHAPISDTSIVGLHIQRNETFKLRISKMHLHGGEILCVAGPNGSGKTTLIECLAGLLHPSTGAITVAGHSVQSPLAKRKAVVGYIPDDEAWLIPELCAAEYFTLLEKIYREAGVISDMQSKVASLCKTLSFGALRIPLSTLSHGNKRKVQIIAGLMHSPQIIIVDELRNGLDPLAIRAAESLIKREAANGASVIAATHDLWWAERVSDRLLLLIDGAPSLYESTDSIIKQYGHIEDAFLAKVSS